MNNFGILLRYELKKLFISKITILLLVLFAGFLFGVTMLEYLVISPEDRNVAEREAELEGKKLDDELMAKVNTEAEKYGSLAAIDGSSVYNHLAHYINRAQGVYLDLPEIDISLASGPLTGESFYRNRDAMLEYLHDYFLLDEAEKDYWRNREAEIVKPFTWQANYGVSSMRANFGMLSALVSITIGICLSGIFASESRYRTDALILCTAEGRKTLPLVKILAAELFSLIMSLILLVSVQLPHVIFNGLHGIETACQIIVPFSSYPYTSGKLLLIYTGIFLLAAMLLGAVTVFLSRILNNVLAAGGVICISVLLDLFLTLPPRFRILSQIRFLTPLQVLINSSMMDPRLIRIGSSYLTAFQTSAILYAALIIILCLLTFFSAKAGHKSSRG